MRAFELFENAVPLTEYGYWVDPNGTVYPVPFQGHEAFMSERGTDNDSALVEGWIRIVAGEIRTVNWFVVELCMGKPSATALRAFSRVLRQYREQDRYEVEIIPEHADTSAAQYPEGFNYWKSFPNSRTLEMYVRSAATTAEHNRQPVTEAVAIPLTHYGYWISPAGTFYPVSFQDHAKVIAGIAEQELGYRLSNHGAMREGWLRIVAEQDKRHAINVEMYAHCGANRAVSALRRLTKTAEWEAFYVTVHEAEKESGLGYGKSFTQPGPFLSYVIQASSPRSEEY